MATPPTRVGTYAPSTGNYTTTTSPKTTVALPALNAGDLIVAVGGSEQAGTNAVVTPTISTGSVTWVAGPTQMTGAAVQSGEKMWFGTVNGAIAAGATVSLARINTGTTLWWGMSVTVWRDHGGVGQVVSTNNGTSASVAQATTPALAANSGFQGAINDWNAIAVATRTYQTVNGSQMSESLYINGASHATAFGFYRTDVGAAGTEVVGLTTPATLRWVMVGVEILGTSGGTAYTGTLSAATPLTTSTVTGTVTAPTWTGTLSAATPKATASIAGTVVAPVYAGSLTASTPLVTSSATGSATVPTYTGSIAASVPLVVAAAAGTTTAPTYTGAVSASVPLVTGSMAGTVTAAPGYTGTLSAPTPAVTGSLTGTVTPPTYTGTLSATTPKATGSMSGTATPPTYTGTLTAAIPPTASTITGTATNPAGSATLSGTVPRVTASMSGTFTAPVWTGTLAGQLARTTATMLGTVTAPVYAGTLGATLPRVTGSASGTVTAPVFSGVLVGTLPVLLGSLAGVVVDDPDYVPPVLEVGPPAPPRFTAAAARASAISVAVPSRSLAAGPARPHRYSHHPSG